MSGLLGKKIGMTSIFDEAGNHLPVTVIEVEPNVITQIKTDETDGYTAVQLATIEKKEKSTTKALKGHFGKASTTPKKLVREFRDYLPEGLSIGDQLTVGDVFTEGSLVAVVGTSKGKGFQGVVRRHGFSGVGGRTHGQHNRERAPGSIGQSSSPSRVFKGMKMAGRMGNSRVKVKNLRVARILADSNLLLLEGAVPGSKGTVVEIHNARPF
ncbi:MAG: 50S ribosomal protein L3 [Cyclonatronaceae bacterium]